MSRIVGMTASTKPMRPVERLEVETPGVMADEVLDERLGLGHARLPGGRVLADDLVGVLAVGQPHDAHVLELDARVVALELADEAGERGHPERAGLLAGGVDVVGERDAVGVAGQQPDLVRGERGAEAGDDVLEARLVGHQRVRVALDDDGLAALADGALGLVDEVQRAALVEQRRRRGVEVLGPLPFQQPATEARPRGRSASRIGNRTRARNLSMTPRPRWLGLARPTSTSSSARMSRLAWSWRAIWSQPSGAQPSWWVSIVASVKPRPLR